MMGSGSGASSESRGTPSASASLLMGVGSSDESKPLYHSHVDRAAPMHSRSDNRRGRAQSFTEPSHAPLVPCSSAPNVLEKASVGSPLANSAPRKASMDAVAGAHAQMARSNRTRALSETGRQLLMGVYNQTLFEKPLVPLSPRPSGMPRSTLSPNMEPAHMPQDPIVPPMQLDGSRNRSHSFGQNNQSMQNQNHNQNFGAGHVPQEQQQQRRKEAPQRKNSATAMQAAASKLRRSKSHESNDGNKNNFAALMWSEDEDEGTDDELNAHLPHRISSDDAVFGNPRGSHRSAVGKIDESVIGEDEAEMASWETVSATKKKSDTGSNAGRGGGGGGQSYRARQRSPPPHERKSRNYGRDSPSSFDMYDSADEGDLYDLQMPTFAGRQVGGAKKAMQFKAAEKRSYAIDKRNVQRYGA